MEERRRTVRVYDLVNAGPRHRFTVRGRLVSNCYLIMYGGHKEKLAKTMRSDRNPDGSLSFPGLLDAEVAFWFDNWHKLHPETKAWQQRTIGFWSQHGFVETILDGRRRYFLGGMDETAIPNMTIQGSAAAIANRAMLGIAAECPHRGWGTMAGPAFQCHDELVVAAPFEYVSRAEALLHKCMPWTDPADGMQYPIEQYTRKTLAGG